MWSRRNKVWSHYRGDIMAGDAIDAAFLANYIRFCAIQRLYLSSFEVVDLQKYKIIKKPGKVFNAIQQRAHIPFVFICSKN
jgi:hypothetical protein